MNKRIISGTISLVAGLLLLSCTLKITKNEDQKPNILFAISDDQSFIHTSFAGCKFINTPAFDRIAKEGIYFANCYAGSSGCAPSRSAIVTGRYPWQNEQSGQHASSWMKKYVPFVDLIKKNGYYTGYTGKGVEPFQYARHEQDSLWRKENAAGQAFNAINYETNTTDGRVASGIASTNYFENFKYFMGKREAGKPFFFWYGCKEPHRPYEEDSWKRIGKKMEDVEVPEFLPDNEIVRGDLLDYAVEIEWFDMHLNQMLNYLEAIGELENTIVIVTSDNGMPFPRAKANSFEYGVHVPFAIRFPKKFQGGRTFGVPISFVDIAPTILEITGTSNKGMQPITGKSMLTMLESNSQKTVDDYRKYVFTGRERQSSSRYLNWGYPQRAIRSRGFLLIWNLKPERWPAGAPQRINPGDPDRLLPMFGIDKNGKHNSEWAFTDIAPSPTKSFIIENRRDKEINPFFEMAVSKRPEWELYDIKHDKFCLINLSGEIKYSDIEKQLRTALLDELTKSKDPRVVGPNQEIFDSYSRYILMREFPKPEILE